MHAMVVAKLAVWLALVLMPWRSVRAAETADFENLTIYRADGTAATVRGFPGRTIRLLFPDGEAAAAESPIPKDWRISSTPLAGKIRTFRVSDRKQSFLVVGAMLGDRLFVFDGVFGDGNSTSMAELMREASAAPRNKTEALDLTRLYLVMAYFRMEDADGFIAYRDPPHDAANVWKFSDMVGIANSPIVTHEGDSFGVDLYAFEPGQVARNRVRHWEFGINAKGFEERMSARDESFREDGSAATGVPGKTGRKARFHLTVMANGATVDGAETDMQVWASSNGPGAERVHYYYSSHEKAEHRMTETVENAVAILEKKPWLDEKGESGGMRMILLRADGEKKLFASIISADEKSVLEITCRSLVNLMASLDRELPSDGR